MEMEIQEKKENKVLGREEVAFLLKFDKVIPARKAVRDELAKKLGCEAKLLVIDAMMPEYGMQEAKCTARVYKDAKGIAVERKYMLVRNGLAEKKAKKVKKKAAPAKK